MDRWRKIFRRQYFRNWRAKLPGSWAVTTLLPALKAYCSANSGNTPTDPSQMGVERCNLPRAGSLLEPSHVVRRALLVSGRGIDVQDGLDRINVQPALDLRMVIGEREATGAVMIRGGNIRPGGADHKH